MLLTGLPDSILLSIAARLLHDSESDIVFGLQDFERALHPKQKENRFFEIFVDSVARSSTCDSSHENARVRLALATLTTDTQARMLDPFLIFALSCSKMMDISSRLLGNPKQHSVSLALSAIQKSKRDRNHFLHAAAWGQRHSSRTAFSSEGATLRSNRAAPTQLAFKRNQQKDEKKAPERFVMSSIDPTRQPIQRMSSFGKDPALHSSFADIPILVSPALSLHEALDTSTFGSTFMLPDGVYDCRDMVISRNNKLLPRSAHRVIFGAGMTIDSVSATIQSCIFSGRQGDTLPLVVIESGSILFENCVFMEAAVAVKISNRNRLNRIGHTQPIVHFVNCIFHSCSTCLDSGHDEGFSGIMVVSCCKFVNCVSCIKGLGVSWCSKSLFERCSSAIHPSADSKTVVLWCTFSKCNSGILMDSDALMLVKECTFLHCYSSGAHMQFDRVSISKSYFCECAIGALISKSSKSRMVDCQFKCCGLAGAQVIDESAPTLISCNSNSCLVGFSTLDNSRATIDSCSGCNDVNSMYACDHSSPQVIRFKAVGSVHGASVSSDSPQCSFLDCTFEKCSSSGFSAHSSFFGVCTSCEANHCATAFLAVINSHGIFKQCKAASCQFAFQLEGCTRAEHCFANESSCGFTGGGLSESFLTHCQVSRCKVGIVVCGNMSVKFCKIQACQEGIVCSGLQESAVISSQISDCATGLALLKLGLVYQCHVIRSSLHGVRFDPSCDINLKSSFIKNCNIGIFNRSGGGLAHSCAVQMCDTGIVLEGEIITCFERCVLDQNQKGCVMLGVLGSGTVKFCVFKRNRMFGIGVLGQGDPGFIVSENTFEENTTGILCDCTSAPLFIRNIVTKNLLSGVLFKPGSSVIFRQNRMIGNRGHGMQVMTNGSCIIEDNIAEKNEKFGVFFLTGLGANDLVFRKNSFNGNLGGGINVAPGSQARISEW